MTILFTCNCCGSPAVIDMGTYRRFPGYDTYESATRISTTCRKCHIRSDFTLGRLTTEQKGVTLTVSSTISY